MIDILTDNKNRTASELRKIFDKKEEGSWEKHGSRLADV